jgi:hypothetical protein
MSESVNIEPDNMIKPFDEEEYRTQKQIENLRAHGVLKRLFVLLLVLLILLVVMYVLLLYVPHYALLTCFILLFSMFAAIAGFVWNEITNHHNTIEFNNFEYHKPKGDSLPNQIKTDE